jgi:DNA-binding MarR family transcriptional regulator
MEELPRVTAATLDVLDALLAADAATWGLRIIGATGRPAGSVYPILARLEERGWVTSFWEDEERRGPRRRLYLLTDEATVAARALLRERRRPVTRAAWTLS